ncbi:MAG: SURF1 family protein [Actinomycetota bacterium]|nr:SURF1 family protein [Actinomycetota bacterium]
MSQGTGSAALRLALTPRWLAAAAALLVFAAATVFLGRWQWDRTQDILAAERAAMAEPAPVESVIDAGLGQVPGESIGRPVTASGAYDPALQAIVANRSLDGRPGVWVITGLRLDDGQLVAVLRGWLPDATGLMAPVPGPVTVSGILHPDEEFYAGAPTDGSVVASVSHSVLEGLWGTTLLPGYVMLQEQAPSISAAPAPAYPTVQTADVPFPLQNFVYAFQWWIFALFAAAVYVRWLWVDARRDQDEAATSLEAP